MRCIAGFSSLVLFVFGCQTPERAAIQPLPADVGPLSYQDLFTRAKSQVSAAQEFFYRDRWREVEQASDALQQTAELLNKVKPDDVPEKQRATLATHTKEFGAAATALHDAGQAKDVNKTSDALQRLNLKIRDLRPD